MRNNKIFARVLAFALAVAMLTALVSCGKKKQEVAFELGEQKITYFDALLASIVGAAVVIALRFLASFLRWNLPKPKYPIEEEK